MRRTFLRRALGIAALAESLVVTGAAAQHNGTRADYVRAEQFLGANAQELVLDDAIQPHWIAGDSARFWFRNRTDHGYEFVVVDAATGARRPAFDHARLAAALSVASDTSVDPRKLSFREIKFVNGERAVRFSTAKGKQWQCDLSTYACAGPDTFPLNRVTEVASPDGKWVAFTRADNLWVRELANGRETQLTKDAEPDYGYAKPTGCCQQVTSVLEKRDQRPVLVWSPDSRRIATYKMDERGVRRMYLLETKTPAAILHEYPYALPGDSVIPRFDTYVIDVASHNAVKVNRPPQSAVNTSCCWLTTDTVAKDMRWDAQSDHLYMTYGVRGFRQLDLLEVDASTGVARTILQEKGKTFVELNLGSGGIPNWRPVHHNRDFVWFSERDGWAHLYLVNGQTGAIEHQITSGAWTVGDVLRIDEPNGFVYFTGRGREPGVDPYFRRLYRAKLDGSKIDLLTPENADHDVSFSPSGAYFVDSYSKLDALPVSQVRRADGTLVKELQRADASGLFALGWRMPVPFTVKARDGVTDLYGLMFRPSKIDPSRKYPIIDNIYPGPQTGPIGNRSFSSSLRGTNAGLAELGFFVIELDASGTPFRSKAFHDSYYGDMGDNGLADHVAAIKQLAARDPQIDVANIGIYGHSGGGFSSTDAMLRFPDFFKVAVSGAGNHDNRSYDYTWGEKYQGLVKKLPTGMDNFDSQSNWRQAANLKGNLLLMYGTMDDNVSPVNTQLLIEELIKANKDFDSLELPNRNHGFASEPYAIRRTWDYFVTHLLGVEPPKGIVLKVPTDR
ncbi:MAG TPA: DPP IV N-terminal domain-containing protein [Gemmatimonadaceae bacterium]|nr:DPP IV N-terminal domain-containing protein [Gemmatimonadaceae bacterium]